MNSEKKNEKDYPRQILAIFGDYCSGKETMVNYLKEKYAYEAFNYVNINENVFHSKRSEVLLKADYASSQVKDIVNDMSKLRICLYPLLSERDLNLLLTKAAFKVVYIASPVKQRLENYQNKHGKDKALETFLSEDYDESASSLLLRVKSKAQFTINNAGSLEEFYRKIDEFVLNVNQPRPNWDDYFMTIAQGVAQRCNCAKTKIGALITKDNRIISVGYNGTASKIANCFEGECARCWSNLQSGQDLDKCICIHAEENALLEAGRKKCIGAKIYTTVLPCLTCAKNIIQCGIAEVIYDAEYDSALTKKLFETSVVKITKWKPAIKYIF